MPTRIVPNQKQDLLADPFELLGTPSEKLRRYRAYGPIIHESQPRLIELWQVVGLTPEDGQTRVSDTGSVEGGPKDAGSNTTLYTRVQSRGGEVGPLLTG